MYMYFDIEKKIKKKYKEIKKFFFWMVERFNEKKIVCLILNVLNLIELGEI